MKSLWFIGGIAVAAILVVGVGAVAAYSGSGSANKLEPVVETTKQSGCGCAHGATQGGCGAAGCGSDCSECGSKKGCGSGCSNGCSK